MTSGVPKAQVLEDPKGVFKVLVDPETDLILGQVSMRKILMKSST